jgi:hypothetical protein
MPHGAVGSVEHLRVKRGEIVKSLNDEAYHTTRGVCRKATGKPITKPMELQECLMLLAQIGWRYRNRAVVRLRLTSG